MLGISRGRDASYARLIKVLSDNGINPNTDVKFLAVGESPTGKTIGLEGRNDSGDHVHSAFGSRRHP